MLSFLFSVAMAATLSCPVIPYGDPVNSDTNVIKICHTGYYTEYSTKNYDPEITIWNVDKNAAISSNKRSGSFKRDPLANGLDASPSDYTGSGYDKGHIADAADFTFDDKQETESFYMTNMTPQLPGLNRGGWKWLETATRYYAIKYGKVVVYSGPIFGIEDSKLNSKVDIPKYFWKIIYVPSTNEALSIIVPNTKIEGKDILKYVVSVSDIENYTKIKISLPSNFDKTKKADVSEWNVSFKTLLDSKND